MVRIEGEIVIKRPVEEVFGFVADERKRHIFKLMEPLVARVGRRQEETIWAGLKPVLERQETAPGRR